MAEYLELIALAELAEFADMETEAEHYRAEAEKVAWLNGLDEFLPD